MSATKTQLLDELRATPRFHAAMGGPGHKQLDDEPEDGYQDVQVQEDDVPGSAGGGGKDDPEDMDEPEGEVDD